MRTGSAGGCPPASFSEDPTNPLKIVGVKVEEEMLIGVKQAGVLGILAVSLVFAAEQGARADDALNGLSFARASAAPASSEFGGVIADGDLAKQRGGDLIIIDTKQKQKITTGNNTIDGDAQGGAATVNGNVHGIANILVNTGPQAQVQGAVTMNLYLNN